VVRELFPYLRVADGHAALKFYGELLGAELRLCLIDPTDGRVGHAELALPGGAVLMVSDAYPEFDIHPPRDGSGASIHLHVDDADAELARWVAAGATLTRPAQDAFYGERSGKVVDPFGHEWMIGHEIEQVTPAEMQRRWDAMVA
jgi:uncharacterized glyoxalase superfamily protein PhnB